MKNVFKQVLYSVSELTGMYPKVHKEGFTVFYNEPDSLKKAGINS